MKYIVLRLCIWFWKNYFVSSGRRSTKWHWYNKNRRENRKKSKLLNLILNFKSLETEFYRTIFWQFLPIDRVFAGKKEREREEERTSENVNLCGRENNAMRAKEIQTGVPAYVPSYIHEISLSKFSFKKKKEEKPSNANADAGAIRSQMCISILRIVPWCVEHVGRKAREFANIKWRRLARAALYVHHICPVTSRKLLRCVLT